MTKRYKLVLAGGDHTHQEQYASQFLGSGRCDIVAVTDAPGVSPQRHALNASLAARFGAPYLPLDEAVARPSDIASVCVGISDRALVATRFAQAGRHLYLDKPMAGNIADAQAIASAVARSGVTTQIFSQATTAWGQAIKERFAADESGAIRAVHMRMLVAKGIPEDLPSAIRIERPAIEPIPGEPVKKEMFDLGYYPVALLDWIVDCPVSHVTAMTANHFFPEHLAADVDDFGSLVIEFENGLLASIVCGRTGWESHPGRGYIEATLQSRRGFVRFTPDADQLLVRTAPVPVRAAGEADPMGMWHTTMAAMPRPPQRPIDIAPDNPACDVLAFLDHLDQGTSPAIDAQRGVGHLAILDAAFRSAAGLGTREAVAPTAFSQK